MKIRYAAKTDVGMKRTHNEDYFSLIEDEQLFLVADGDESEEPRALVYLEDAIQSAATRYPRLPGIHMTRPASC